MKSVVQEWLCTQNLSLKQQTVLLSCLRGCDGQSKFDISKSLTRKLRNAILINAAEENSSFMKNGMTLDQVRDMAEDADKYPIHYLMHACHACEIIGYKHPDPKIRHWFNKAYLIIVDAMHLKPESSDECDFRLRDGVNTPYT